MSTKLTSTNPNGDRPNNQKAIKGQKRGLTMIQYAVLGLVIAGLTYAGFRLLDWQKNNEVVTAMNNVITLVSESTAQYKQLGASCTGFTMAFASPKFSGDSTNYDYNAATQELTFDDGNIVATADCTTPPGAGAPDRVELLFAGISDKQCMSIVSSATNSVSAVQVAQSGSTTQVIIKNYEEQIPSGRTTLGTTSCIPGVESDVTLWLR